MIRNLKALGYVGADSPVPQAGRETVPEADAGRPEEGRVEASGAGVSESGSRARRLGSCTTAISPPG